MTANDHLPAAWDDTDLAIFDARVRQRLTWRLVGEQVRLDWSAARRRFYRRLAQIEPEDVEAYRAEEGFKLDELEASQHAVYARAFAAASLPEQNKALKQLGDIHRQRAILMGLNQPQRVTIEPPEVPDLEKQLDRSLDAYMQGIADGSAGAPQHPA